MKLLLVFTLAAVSMLHGQGTQVDIFQGPGQNPLQTLIYYPIPTVSYICYAYPTRTNSTVVIASATAANPAVFTTSSDNGFFTGAPTNATPRVNISGAAGSWAALAGDFLLTALTTTTFTLANVTTGVNFDGTGLGALSGTVTLATSAPRMTMNVWSIVKIVTDANNQMTKLLAYGDANVRGVWANKCNDRAAAFIEWR